MVSKECTGWWNNQLGCANTYIFAFLTTPLLLLYLTLIIILRFSDMNGWAFVIEGNPTTCFTNLTWRILTDSDKCILIHSRLIPTLDQL